MRSEQVSNYRLKQIINEIDEDTFVLVSDVSTGEGF